MTTEKYYLEVQYDKRNQAKLLGARWDAECKKWYCFNDKTKYSECLIRMFAPRVKIYLNKCNYNDRNDAKKLGAKWDPGCKKWYVYDLLPGCEKYISDEKEEKEGKEGKDEKEEREGKEGQIIEPNEEEGEQTTEPGEKKEDEKKEEQKKEEQKEKECILDIILRENNALAEIITSTSIIDYTGFDEALI